MSCWQEFCWQEDSRNVSQRLARPHWAARFVSQLSKKPQECPWTHHSSDPQEITYLILDWKQSHASFCFPDSLDTFPSGLSGDTRLRFFLCEYRKSEPLIKLFRILENQGNPTWTGTRSAAMQENTLRKDIIKNLIYFWSFSPSVLSEWFQMAVMIDRSLINNKGLFLNRRS